MLLLFAVLTASGSHWILLQSVAWTTLFASNLRTNSLSAATHLTFDGKHPCSLCKTIASGKKSEHKKEFPLQFKKLEFPPAPGEALLLSPSLFQLLPQEKTFAQALPQEPPTPPLRDRSV